MPTPILNLRVTKTHQVKLLITHYGPGLPHARLRLNGKHDTQIYEVPEAEDSMPISILLDLQEQDIRKYNLLEIIVSN